MAADVAIAAPIPPTNYRVTDVELRVVRQHAHGQPTQQLVLTGKGKGTLEQGRGEQRFTFTDDELIRYASGLYQIRFFEFAAQFGPRQSVFLRPDGTVGLQIQRRSDVTTTSVCLAVASYEKCVRYAEGEGPAELEGWVQSLFADTVRRLANEKR